MAPVGSATICLAETVRQPIYWWVHHFSCSADEGSVHIFLADEFGHVVRLHAAADLARGFGFALGLGLLRDGGFGFFGPLALLLNLGRIKPVAAQLLDGIAFGVGADDSGLLLAFGVESAIDEVGHGVGLERNEAQSRRHGDGKVGEG